MVFREYTISPGNGEIIDLGEQVTNIRLKLLKDGAVLFALDKEVKPNGKFDGVIDGDDPELMFLGLSCRKIFFFGKGTVRIYGWSINQ